MGRNLTDRTSLATARKLGERLRLTNPSTANAAPPPPENDAAEIEQDISVVLNHLGTIIAGRYEKDAQCLPAIKTASRMIKEDGRNEKMTVLRKLVNSGIVHTDLIPALVSTPNDFEMWRFGIRLMYELTIPGHVMLDYIPADRLQDNPNIKIYIRQLDEQRQLCKKYFLKPEFFKTLRDHLCLRVQVPDEERQQEDTNFIGLSLQLLRNIFEMRGELSGGDAESPEMVQDAVFRCFTDSGLSGVVLFLSSADESARFGLVILDLIYQIFRNHDPESLGKFSAEQQPVTKSSESRLAALKALENASKNLTNKPIDTVMTRHSNFGGSFVLKGSRAAEASNEMVLMKPAAVILGQQCEITAGKKRVGRGKKKNTKAVAEERKSAPPVVSHALKLFCQQFVENSYNVFMEGVKESLGTLPPERAEQYTEKYLWAMRFFMAFNRSSTFDVSFVNETLSVDTFYYLHTKLEQFSDMGRVQKEKARVWAEREHLALRAYQELLLNLSAMAVHPDEKVSRAGRQMEMKLFYVPEYREVFFTLLREFRETKHSRAYLKDLILTVHIFIKLLENFLKTQDKLFVKKKLRKKKGEGKKAQKAAKPKKISKVSEEERKKIFADQLDKVKELLQDKDSVDKQTPWDEGSDQPIDEQMSFAQYRIQAALIDKDTPRAVGLLLASKETWINKAFGSETDSVENDVKILEEILLMQLQDFEQEKDGADIAELFGDDDSYEPGAKKSVKKPAANVESEVPESEQLEEEGEPDEEEDPNDGQDDIGGQSSVNEVEFHLEDYIKRFATPAHLEPYFILFRDHTSNSDLVNHAIIKLLHRVAFDLKLPGMLFQMTFFRLYQSIVNDPFHGIARSFDDRRPSGRYEEVHQFMKFLLGKFFEKMREDPKTILFTLCWKSRGEAHELVDGPVIPPLKLKRGRKGGVGESLDNADLEPVSELRPREESPDDDDWQAKLQGITNDYNPKKDAVAVKKQSVTKKPAKRVSTASSSRSPSPVGESNHELDEDPLKQLREMIAKQKAERNKAVIRRPATPEYIPAVRRIGSNDNSATTSPLNSPLRSKRSRDDVEEQRTKSPDEPFEPYDEDEEVGVRRKKKRLVRVIEEDDSNDGADVGMQLGLGAEDEEEESVGGNAARRTLLEDDEDEGGNDKRPLGVAPEATGSSGNARDDDSDDEDLQVKGRRPRLVIDDDDD